MAEDPDPEERCPACRGSARCQRCRGNRFRVLAGNVRVACADCQGTGRCHECSAGARSQRIGGIELD